MLKKIKNILSPVLGLIIISLLTWLTYWIVKGISSYINSIPKELGAALIAGVSAVVVSTITVMIGRYFERKKELDSLYREKKMEIYDEFLKKFFDLFFSEHEISPTKEPDDLVPFLREFMRKLLLWSGPNSIVAFLEWKAQLKSVPNAKTIFSTEKFLLSLRADLGHSNKNIPTGFFATLILKEGDLFLAMAKQNPNVTLEQLAKVEKMLQHNST